MRIEYIRTKESRWSWDDKLAEKLGRQALARKMKARKVVNTILGACMVGVGMGKEPLQLLAEAERGNSAKKASARPGAKLLCEL